MIEIPLKVKDPNHKFKFRGLGAILVGLALFGYMIFFFLKIPNAQIVVVGMVGLALVVIGAFIFVLPSAKMAKYFFTHLRQKEGKDVQPLFVLDDFVELYELYGRLYYQIGDYKRSEIFYGLSVLLKQQRYDPSIMQIELGKAKQMIKKVSDQKGKGNEKQVKKR
jgi:putative NIF3 family GTP cyclohydrolase 1 type 2